ncbi:MAG: Mannonate dehydratase [uncultured Microvirga sp.]|uniref:Mannonate dehydratase n=1 Tax=uncultured Microvirga sp. TaxID=412392 RepID=A0A6J4KZ48_9HYPH|nr:MAG: Mannonate dehydratase [uncultured Microvirga sp.]
MRQGWRWYGPGRDGVSLDDIRQAGATTVVTSLHDVPIGEAWTTAAVGERKRLIEDAPAGRERLTWSVVESIPIPDAVKRTGRAAKRDIDAWIASLEAVGANGVPIVCYNFMPVLDWTRTDLDHVLPTGATALRFDQEIFAAFDLHILARDGVEADYTPEERARAKRTYEAMSEAEIEGLIVTIASALPGSTTDPLSIPAFRERLRSYAGVDATKLRQHLIEFLEAVTPAAEAAGVTLTLHPDDPPRPLFGLPRIASTEADYAALFKAVPSPANGMCFCTGSLGVRPDNDLPGIARRLGDRIHFIHLRATKREADPRSFHEAAHLEGDVDMVAVLRELVAVDQGRSGADKIVFRPDHGHRMLDDLGKAVNPGYAAIGRLKGLAELRGILHALGAPPN